MYIKLFSEMLDHVIIHEDYPVCVASFEIRFSEDVRLGMAYYYSDNTFKFNWITAWPQKVRYDNELRVKDLVIGFYAERVLLEEIDET